MDQVLTFDKTLQQRLQEYRDVLAGYEILPVSAIEKEWSFYLELTVDPNGWQALWKIQRKTCEALNIPFPSVVIVLILDVHFKDMTALVRVLAVQDDIHIPDKHIVPLIQLWPTKDQDKSVVMNLQSTANVLDMLRFFYRNLLMPWDFEEEDSSDWKTKHLEPRLRLYYDMQNGVIPRVAAEHIQSLLTEAKKLQVKREFLESELEDFEDDSVDVENSKLQQLMELHIRMMDIKKEVDIMENPLLRNALIKQYKNTSLNHDDSKQHIWVVYNEGTADHCIEFMTKVKSLYPDEILNFSPKLSTTLECANTDDVFLVNEGTHEIKNTGALENGGILKSLASREKTILTSTIEDVMLDCRGQTITIENMTIQANTPQCAIIVRRGQLTLKNCKIVGDGKSSTHQGIIILNGGNLKLIDCDLSHFYTAIVGNSGSTITMENSEIHDCNFGLKIYDNCAVRAVKATIRNCKEYGICVETENSLAEDQAKTGDFDSLNIIPELQMEFMKGNNNVKGDAIINQISKLKAVENLFENPDSDPTVCIESDEEMETNQITVIENGRISPATI